MISQQDNYQFTIVGSGLRGIGVAKALLDRGVPGSEISMIEAAPFFGGSVVSVPLNGFMVDAGVHMFDAFGDSLQKFIVDMDASVESVKVRSSSSFGGAVTPDFSLPDLASLTDDKKNLIWSELQNMPPTLDANSVDRSPSLAGLFKYRYGGEASEIFESIFARVYRLPASQVEADAIFRTSLGRLKFGSDDEMWKLKTSTKFLDDVIAVSKRSLASVQNVSRTFYPASGEGFNGFVKSCEKFLKEAGVSIKFKTSLGKIEPKGGRLNLFENSGEFFTSTTRLIWENDNFGALESLVCNTNKLPSLAYGTPMRFVIFGVRLEQISDFTYHQNFNSDGLTYRTANAGQYSGQVKNGVSFVTCECPVGGFEGLDDEVFLTKVWDEIAALHLVEGSPIWSEYRDIPKTFRMYRSGFRNAFDELRSETLEAFDESISICDPSLFFKKDILAASVEKASVFA